ncbi:MAG: hypothetical protein JXR48_11395 [Candidatus Delongbacteria bacterium]|nr:hypothetical protein [Candidatus Delongbacteria bacterium]MBN2835557.1 hypothetical protein [Candidatus Delongbacteria bacterium]
MKLVILILIFSLNLLFPKSVDDLLNFGNFNVEVVKQTKISSFTGEDGELLKPSKRDLQFYELELQITANESGEFCLYPHMFSGMFYYRDVPRVIKASALGTKVKENKVVKEYWYTLPDVSVAIEVEKGESFKRYIILEIPKEVKSFKLIGPSEIGMVKL